MQPKIKSLPTIKLIGMSQKMSLAHNKTHEFWSRFMKRRSEIKNSTSSDFYSVQVYDSSYFEDFSLDNEFEKWAAVAVSDFDSIPDGMEAHTLKSGLYAVFLHKGTASDGAKAFQYIFQTWLPNSGYFLDDRPHFEILGAKYKNNDPDSEEEIWIPIKSKR